MLMDPEKPLMEYHMWVVLLTINRLENLFLYKDLYPKMFIKLKMFSLHLYIHLHNKRIIEKYIKALKMQAKQSVHISPSGVKVIVLVPFLLPNASKESIMTKEFNLAIDNCCHIKIIHVCLLATIKGHSKMCRFTVLGGGGGSENQAVSGVTTICLTQCSTSPSHRVDQVVDCGLWEVGPLLFNGCVKLMDIGMNWNMLSYTPIQSIPNMLNG